MQNQTGKFIFMPSPAKAQTPKPGKEVTLTLSYGAPNFKWQMAFNSYTIEKVSNGCLLRVAYATGRAAELPDIVPILISNEGIEHLRASTVGYLKDFVNVPKEESLPLPTGRNFTPLFTNHLRLSRSGRSAEIACYTVMLSDIAVAAQGNLGGPVNCVQVALLHSDLVTHRNVLFDLLAEPV